MLLSTQKFSTQFYAWLLIGLQLSTHVLGALQHVEQSRQSFHASSEVASMKLDLLDIASFENGLAANNQNEVEKNQAKNKVNEKENDTTKRSIEKRSVEDLLNMDHPDFVGDHWMDTFRNHVKEIHKRGHKLHIRQEPVDQEMVMKAFEGSNEKFEVYDEAARLSQLPNPQNLTYKQVPVDAKEIFTGVIVGIGGVLVPGLKEANNGSEALATFQQCFDPRKLHETFVIKDFFKVQEELPTITEADLDEFATSTMADGGTANELLGRFQNLKANAWRTWKYLAAILKKLGPYMLTLLKHSQKCGVLDIVLGFAISFIIPFFPPMLLILVAVAAMAFELFTQIKAAVDNWYKDWFKFGKAVGAIVAFIISLVVSYLMSRSKSVACNNGKGKGCTYEMPANEMENFKPPKAKRHCGGELCNPVYRRDDLIDPYRLDSMGRTNVQRMKAGSAAIGPDGQPINLHHIHQTPDGEIAELTDTFHSVNSKELHRFLDHGEPSRIDRDAFGVWRSSYWRNRGREMEAALAAGTHIWVNEGANVANYGPLAITAVVKSWDSIKEQTMSAGDFLAKVLDDITEGDPESKVTSVKKGLGKFDVFRLLLKALKGKAVDEANATDNQMSPVNSGMEALLPGQDGMAATAQCSLDAMCDRPLGLEPHAFERADTVVHNTKEKRFDVHFAPDTGFALSLSTLINEGQVDMNVRSPEGVALAAHERRGASKTIKKADVTAEFPDARHEVTLQHCDGFGTYSLLIKGNRPAPSAEEFDSPDPEWKEFWAKNGGPPNPEESVLSVGAQYVPYPTLAADAKAQLVDSTSDGIVLSAPKALIDGARYSVYVADSDAPALATSCDLLRQATKVVSVDHDAQLGDTVELIVPNEQAGGRAYVVAESEGGAMTIYDADDESTEDSAGILLPGSGAAMIAGIVIAIFVVLCMLGVCLLYYLKKSGKISTRLPTYNKHEKKIVMQ